MHVGGNTDTRYHGMRHRVQRRRVEVLVLATLSTEYLRNPVKEYGRIYRTHGSRARGELENGSMVNE